MSNLNKRQRDYFYPILVKRDGEFCWKCQKTKDEAGILEIHEIQYTIPLDSSYMRLLCHACNHNPLLRKQEILSQQERDPSHEKNIQCEPYYEDWLYGQITSNNWHITLTDAIDNGAYETGISVITAKRYLRKLTSKTAPYAIHASSFGIMHVWLKSKMPKDEAKYF